MDALNALEAPVVFTLTPQSEKGVKMHVEANVDGKLWEKEVVAAAFPTTVKTPVGQFKLVGDMKAFRELEDDLDITVCNPVEAAQAYLGDLSISLVSRTSSVVKMEFNSPDKKMGQDFLRELIRCYNFSANEDKNQVAMRTADFLQNRIEAITRELEITDEQLEKFKRNAGLTYIETDAKDFLQESSRYRKDLVDADNQLSLLRYLNNYVQDKKNKDGLIPEDIGLNDASLSKTIEAHNQLVLEFRRLSRTSSANNPVSINLKHQIRGSFQNVVTSLENTYSGLLLTKREIERKTRLYSSKINDVPAQERAMTEIIRKQETKSSLYLNLLQKMEENASMLKAVTEYAKFIDAPYSKVGPSSPKKSVALAAAILLAGLLALMCIFFRETFSQRVLHVDEVTSRFANLPFVGRIHRQKKKNDAYKEFEKLKVRLMMALDDMHGKALCVFSYNEKDGKSYLTSRLADGFAQTGKRILLVHVITGKAKKSEVTKQPDPLQNLYEYTVTATELPFLTDICSNFDYILIDGVALKSCPEMLMVGKVIDCSVYVCRVGHSERNSLDELMNF